MQFSSPHEKKKDATKIRKAFLKQGSTDPLY